MTHPTEPPIELPIVIVHSDGCKWVGFDHGPTEYLGQQYRIVSPYLDSRPKHWVSPETPITVIGQHSTPDRSLADRIEAILRKELPIIEGCSGEAAGKQPGEVNVDGDIMPHLLAEEIAQALYPTPDRVVCVVCGEQSTKTDFVCKCLKSGPDSDVVGQPVAPSAPPCPTPDSESGRGLGGSSSLYDEGASGVPAVSAAPPATGQPVHFSDVPEEVHRVAMALAAYAYEHYSGGGSHQDVGLFAAENAGDYEGEARAAIAAMERESDVLARVLGRLESREPPDHGSSKVAKASGIGFEAGIQAAVMVIREEQGRKS